MTFWQSILCVLHGTAQANIRLMQLATVNCCRKQAQLPWQSFMLSCIPYFVFQASIRASEACPPLSLTLNIRCLESSSSDQQHL